MGERVAIRTIDGRDIDLRPTLRPQGMYPADPTHRSYPRGFAKAVLTPDGPGTIRLTWDVAGRIRAEAWGSGSGWLIDGLPEFVGLCDDVSGFEPSHDPRVREWWRRHGRVRLSRGRVVWQELVLVLLGQRVTTESAVQSWRRLCHGWGEPAPGPCELMLPPTPDVVSTITVDEFHRLDVERRRAEAILLAARRSARLEEAATMTADDALARLSALPGFGAWTATSVVTVCHGDPDTIVLRDYGLPTLVNYAFTGDARHLPPDEGGDEIMCRHLEPWRGHRQRVVRLLFAVGIRPPRRGARRAHADIRHL